MKRFLGGASLLLLAGLPVLAAAGQPDHGWIVGLRGGVTLAETDSSDLDAELAARGHTVSTDLDGHDQAFVLSLAYRLSALTAIETSVGSLGEYSVAASGTSPDAAQLSRDLIEQKPAGGRFVSLGLRQDLPITSKLALTARGALIGWRQESKINNGLGTTKVDDEDLGWMFGLAGTVLVTPAVGLSLGADWYDQDQRGAIGLLHAGAEYRF
ncbi:MAG: hypothetical protein Q8Q73_10735 [Stagnimonas sp.]|nr:hypothetical protein [Stagnimonas sp.]